MNNLNYTDIIAFWTFFVNHDGYYRRWSLFRIAVARGILENTNPKASRLILKVLNSAAANAVNNNGANESELVISECYINPGQVLKRIKFGSRTKVDRRDKRTSHITVKVSDNKEAK